LEPSKLREPKYEGAPPPDKPAIPAIADELQELYDRVCEFVFDKNKAPTHDPENKPYYPLVERYVRQYAPHTNDHEVIGWAFLNRKGV